MPLEQGNINVRYTGTEADQIFFEPVFWDEDISSTYKVMPNVVTSKKMQFAEKLEKIVRSYTGCGFSPIGGLSVYERKVTVERMKIDLELCWDEFVDTVFEELLKRGDRIHDLTGTVLEDILLQRVQQALKLDIERLYFFGDTTSGNVDYEQIDGLWTVKIPALVTANLVPYYNTGSGTALTDGEGIDRIKTVFDNSPNELKALPAASRRIMVSPTVYLQYIEDIEEGGGGDFGLQAMINGLQNVSFRGVPVKPFWRWNDIMDTDLGNTESHLVLHTSPQNLVVATDLVSGVVSGFTVWYDEEAEKLKVKVRFKLGCDYVHHSLMSVGY